MESKPAASARVARRRAPSASGKVLLAKCRANFMAAPPGPEAHPVGHEAQSAWRCHRRMPQSRKAGASGKGSVLQHNVASDGDVSIVDGRVLRGIRTRQAIVSAARDLCLTGDRE